MANNTPADRPKLRGRGNPVATDAPVKRGRGPDKRKRTYPKNRKPGCGRKSFIPTQSEKVFVHCMSGMKMTHLEIARVIGAGRGTDGMFGKPIGINTLLKHFKKELEAGPSLLRAQITGNYYRALQQGEAWATQFGLRNRFGWSTGQGVAPPLAALGDGDTPMPVPQITFVVPGHGESEREPEPPPRPVPGQLALPKPAPTIDTPFGRLGWDDPPRRDGRTYDGPASDEFPRIPVSPQVH